MNPINQPAPLMVALILLGILALCLLVALLLKTLAEKFQTRPPLTWDKEKGFNRAPTLDEARKYSVNEGSGMSEAEYMARMNRTQNGGCADCDN